MKFEDYKYKKINGKTIAYRECGTGDRPFLLLHGLTSSSASWARLLKKLPEERFRFIAVDLIGFGKSEKDADSEMSPFGQSAIISDFIIDLALENIVIAGHSLGAAVALLLSLDSELSRRISALIIFNTPVRSNYDLSKYINSISIKSLKSHVFKFINERQLFIQISRAAYFDEKRIDYDAVESFSQTLSSSESKDAYLAAVEQYKIPSITKFINSTENNSIPAMIIWGKNDTELDLSDAELIKTKFNTEIEFLDECGHMPHEEKAEKSAEIICRFLEINLPESSDEKSFRKSSEEKYEAPKIKMSRLVDSWHIGVLFFMLFIKFMQLLKFFGIKARENGWRKACSIFLRKEHSKFVLASFRLKYFDREKKLISNNSEARQQIIDKLADFLHKTPASQWAFTWKFWRTYRIQLNVTDIMEAEFDSKGKLAKIIPHFDRNRPDFLYANNRLIQKALSKLVDFYNRDNKNYNLSKSWKIFKKMKKWVRSENEISFTGRQELKRIISRIMNSTFVIFEYMKSSKGELLEQRLKIPRFNRYRHPGFGLLNIVCRLNEDLSEADLWTQFHHVPVDGLPMQEELKKLKNEWGAAGPVKYPSLKSQSSSMDIFCSSKNVFRGRIFLNFEQFIKIRKYLNRNYFAEMEGKVTFLSMIAWGIARHSYFKKCKFLIPFDTSESSIYSKDEHSLSLIFIKPCKYYDENKKLNGFLDYAREFNKKLFSTKLAKSESYELLELYSMVHPLFFYIARYLMPRVTAEVVGTAGITMLKDAEMFVSPLTDLQQKGFVALGNLTVPTVDGETAGAATMCGSKKQVREYMKALSEMTSNFEESLA